MDILRWDNERWNDKRWGFGSAANSNVSSVKSSAVAESERLKVVQILNDITNREEWSKVPDVDVRKSKRPAGRPPGSKNKVPKTAADDVGATTRVEVMTSVEVPVSGKEKRAKVKGTN